MSKPKPLIVVIGLGHFGRELARVLARECEVLALDHNMDLVNEISDDVQRAVRLDARDYSALREVVSEDFDEAIVSIGDNLESSILTTLHLREIGVKKIRAKAITQDHAKILKTLGAEEIVFPEEETAQRLARKIVNPNLLDFIPLGPEYRVVEWKCPNALAGHTLQELQLRPIFGLFVIGVRAPRREQLDFMPGPMYRLELDSLLILIGKQEGFELFEQEPERGLREAEE